jgi:hypothetical protein
MERLTASRAQAIGESLRKLDPATANALVAHGEWLKQAEGALREANIQLAAPHLQTHTVMTLRDRIDALLEIVPRAKPINQSDDE